LLADIHGTAWVKPSTRPQPSITTKMVMTMRRANAGLAMPRSAVFDTPVPMASSAELMRSGAFWRLPAG
jgi:hypothetical protein